MESTTALRLQFSQEELLYLISVFKVGSFPGLQENLLADFSEQEQKLLLRAGYNSLQARGLSSFDQETGSLKFDSLVLALFSTAVKSLTTIFIGRNPVGAMPEATYFHWNGRMMVAHELVDSQVHALTAYFEKTSAAAAIQEKLKLSGQPNFTFPSLSIVSAKFDEMLKYLLQDNQEAAKALCQGAGLDEETANMLVSYLHNMTANATLMATEFDESRVVTRGAIYAWIESPSGLVRVESTGETEKEIVHLSKFQPEEVVNSIPEWLPERP